MAGSAQATDSIPDKMDLKAYLAVFAIAIGFILNPVNGSLVVTAYPHMADVFDVPYAHMSALVMYFMAATAATQPLAGGIGDSIGRKKLFLIGIAGFTVASWLAAVATTFNELLVWRISQAVFSGVILANAMGLVGQVVPAAKTGRYLGVLNSIMVCGTATGFPLGGILVSAYDWPMLFWVSVPMGIVAFVLAIFCLPKDEPRKTHFTSVSFIGLPFLPLAYLLQCFIQGDPTWPGAVLLLATLALVSFGMWRSGNSQTQFKAINNAPFNFSCCIVFFTACIQFGVIFTLPAWTLVSLGIDSSTLGLYLTGFSLSIFLTSPVAGRLLDQHGTSVCKWVSPVLFTAGYAILLWFFNAMTFMLAIVLLGIAIAVAMLIGQRTAMLALPRESHALGMGLFSSWRSMGGLSGNALAAIVMSAHPTVTVQAGVDVFQWQLMLFILPLALSFFYLRDDNVRR